MQQQPEQRTSQARPGATAPAGQAIQVQGGVGGLQAEIKHV